MNERLLKLTELDQKISEALLGNGKHTRYDLLELRKRVRQEIRKITARSMV